MLSSSECLVCVCVCACVCVCVCVSVLFIYTISISICVSKVEPSLIESNLKVDFWKEKTFWKVNFWYQQIIHLIIYCSKGSCCEKITDVVNIYLYGCVSLLAPECVVCVCVCVISNIVDLEFMCQTSVNLMPYYIKPTSRSFWY